MEVSDRHARGDVPRLLTAHHVIRRHDEHLSLALTDDKAEALFHPPWSFGDDADHVVA